METLAKRLYSLKKVKILTLKEIELKVNPKVNVCAEFAILLKQISRSLFLTLAGGTQETSSNDSLFDLL
jgi:hypothetical protein